MCSTSELLDGIEPHDHIYSAVVPGKRVPVAAVLVGGVYPGWCRQVGTGRVHTGTQPTLDLRLIYGILRIYRFIRPFD